jgi:hypothetical protein
MQLVINTFGASLRKDGDRFLVKAGDKQAGFSAHKVQTILVTTGVLISSDAIKRRIRFTCSRFAGRTSIRFGLSARGLIGRWWRMTC